MTSAEGAQAWRLLTETGGPWIRAGMDGSVCGLDIAACLARPSSRDCCAEALELLLTMAEGAAVRALNARRPTE